MTDNQNNNFIKNFENIDKFYDYTPYVKETGFSIKKELKGGINKNTSLLKFYIPDNSKYSEKRKPIIISATYGKKSDKSVIIRDKIKISDPIDLISKNEYYYNADINKLYKGKKEISPSELVKYIYNLHIKPTKYIKGFWLRTKLFFWKVIMEKFFAYISIFLHHFLYIISGDKYSYKPILREEILNNKIINSNFKEMIGEKENKEMKEHLKKGRKFNFLGYEASRWTILFYSMLHLLFYIIFEYKNWHPAIIITILKNNFLTLIYVISSLWVMEIVVPTILKMFIKIISTLSWYSYIKKIKV